MAVDMPIYLHKLGDALALLLQPWAEVHPAHILHQDVNFRTGGEIHAQRLFFQQLPVVEGCNRLPLHENIGPVVGLPQPELFQALLCVQSGVVQDVAVTLTQLLHRLGPDALGWGAQILQN